MDETLICQFVGETNQMYASLLLFETDRSLGCEDSSGSLFACATAGYSILRNVAYVQALLDDMRTLAERAGENYQNMQNIMTADHFEFFLEAEKGVLQAAGADSSLTMSILQQCRDMREAARRGEFSAFTFRSALEVLRDAVCGVLNELPDSATSQRPPRRLHRRLRACYAGVCGCLIVGLDASAFAASVGLTAAGTAVSAAVGAAIVDHAIGDLRAAGSNESSST